MSQFPEDIQKYLDGYEKDAHADLNAFAVSIDGRPLPQTIYHYTTDAGLYGILGTGNLWLSDIFAQNDPSELRHGFEIAIRAFDDWSKHTQADIQDLRRSLDKYREVTTVEDLAHFFICCFSICGDELGQWRSYADDGRGYALGFDTKSLERKFIEPIPVIASGAITPITFSITYDDDCLARLQNKLVYHLTAPSTAEWLRSTRANLFGRRKYFDELVIQHLQNATTAALFFKHKAYQNEQEYRFLQIFGADKSGIIPNLKNRNAISFRGEISRVQLARCSARLTEEDCHWTSSRQDTSRTLRSRLSGSVWLQARS